MSVDPSEAALPDSHHVLPEVEPQERIEQLADSVPEALVVAPSTKPSWYRFDSFLFNSQVDLQERSTWKASGLSKYKLLNSGSGVSLQKHGAVVFYKAGIRVDYIASEKEFVKTDISDAESGIDSNAILESDDMLAVVVAKESLDGECAVYLYVPHYDLRILVKFLVAPTEESTREHPQFGLSWSAHWYDAVDEQTGSWFESCLGLSGLDGTIPSSIDVHDRRELMQYLQDYYRRENAANYLWSLRSRNR